MSRFSSSIEDSRLYLSPEIIPSDFTKLIPKAYELKIRSEIVIMK